MVQMKIVDQDIWQKDVKGIYGNLKEYMYSDSSYGTIEKKG